MFRWINRFMIVAFLAFAVLQWNDPDPFGWIVVYAQAALFSAIIPRSRHGWTLALLLGVPCVVWIAAIAPGAIGEVELTRIAASMDDKTPAIEIAREALGLAIVAAWMTVLGIRSYRRRSGATPAPPDPVV